MPYINIVSSGWRSFHWSSIFLLVTIFRSATRLLQVGRYIERNLFFYFIYFAIISMHLQFQFSACSRIDLLLCFFMITSNTRARCTIHNNRVRSFLWPSSIWHIGCELYLIFISWFSSESSYVLRGAYTNQSLLRLWGGGSARISARAVVLFRPARASASRATHTSTSFHLLWWQLQPLLLSGVQ